MLMGGGGLQAESGRREQAEQRCGVEQDQACRHSGGQWAERGNMESTFLKAWGSTAWDQPPQAMLSQTIGTCIAFVQRPLPPLLQLEEDEEEAAIVDDQCP